MERIFELKQINFLGRRVQILCQNENGPCPLLAIANALLLQNRFTIHADRACISLSDLIAEVAEVIVESTAKMVTNNDMTRQQLLDSVLVTLPKLAKGLDLNVRFTGVSDYEFTQEISVFDALDIPLVHGWVLDPQDRTTASVIENQSYNHLMFKLVEYKSLVDRLAAADAAAAAADAAAAAAADATPDPSKSVTTNTAVTESAAAVEQLNAVPTTMSSPSALVEDKGSDKHEDKGSDKHEDKLEYVLVSTMADSKEGDSANPSPIKQPIQSTTTTTLLDDSPVIVAMDVEECKDPNSSGLGSTGLGSTSLNNTADDKGDIQTTIPSPVPVPVRPQPTADELVLLQQGACDHRHLSILIHPLMRIRIHPLILTNSLLLTYPFVLTPSLTLISTHTHTHTHTPSHQHTFSY